MKLIKMMADQVIAFVVLGVIILVSFLAGFFLAKIYYSAAINTQKEIQESVDALVKNEIPAPKGNTWCREIPIDDFTSPKGITYIVEVCESK